MSDQTKNESPSAPPTFYPDGYTLSEKDREWVCEHAVEFRTSKNVVLAETADVVLAYERTLAAALKSASAPIPRTPDGAAMFSPEMRQAVKQLVVIAERDGATSLGVGTVCALAVLDVALGNDPMKMLLNNAPK